MPEHGNPDPSPKETLSLTGGDLVQTVKKLIHEGNVRRIVIKHGGHAVLELPLSVGVAGVVLAPMLAAVGALAALLNDYTIDVERAPETPPTSP